jgi:DNA-binding CsgD family transcriptional regulator
MTDATLHVTTPAGRPVQPGPVGGLPAISDRIHVGAQRGVASAVAAGVGVLLWGEGGIGKSTALDLVSRDNPGPVLRGGGLESLRSTPYLVFTRAIRLPVPPGDRVAAADFIVRAAGRDALLVLDDLHWADADSLAVLELLAGQVSIVAAASSTDRGGDAARAAATVAGFEVHPLAAVDHEALAGVVRTVNRRLPAPTVARIVSASGGNPLVASLLAADPDGGDVRRLLVRRAARLDRAGRTALATLGLLGRPAPAALLGVGAASLVRADEVVVEHGLVRPRLPLLARVAADQLDPDTRAALHRALATALDDPAEAARHHHAAGDHAAAHAAALAAAGSGAPGETARHLALAARTAGAAHPTDRRGADEVRMGAALACSEAGEHTLALLCLEGVDTVSLDAADRARLALVDARASLAAGDPAGAREAATTALSTADADTRALLRLEATRAALALDPLTALVDAEAAVGEARTDEERARALVVLGSATLSGGAAGWRDHLDEAVTLARRCGAVTVEVAATAALAVGRLQAGDPAGAGALATEGLSRAREARLEAWATRFEGIELWLTVHHRGDLVGADDAGTALLDRPLPPSVRAEVAAHVALARADGGDLEGACELLASSPAAGPATGITGWVAAEIDRLRGLAADALVGSQAILDRPAEWPATALAALTAAWSADALGSPVELGRSGAGIGGSAVELAALERRRAGEPAADDFATAAAIWEGQMQRSALRCAWAAADERVALDPAAAETALDEVATRAEAAGLAVLRGPVARTRRRLGDRRPAPVEAAAGPTLTGREREVLELVATGSTTPVIARRLSIAPSTVETHVKAAMRKLGAATRTEAAVKALEL